MAIDKTSFFKDVYEVVKLIPTGRITSYGAIGNYLGVKGSARMVGWAMNQAGAYPDVPAHRVVNRNGILSGKHHFGGDRMQSMLEAEGLIIEEDKIMNFKENYWDPTQELGL